MKVYVITKQTGRPIIAFADLESAKAWAVEHADVVEPEWQDSATSWYFRDENDNLTMIDELEVL